MITSPSSEDGGARVSTDPRLSRRRRAVERTRRRRLFARCAVGVAVVVALWAAFWSPVLRVRAVKVVGARHTTSADVRAAARLDSSDNLLVLSTSEVARRAASLPWVRRARVERMLPGTIKVSIVERRPAMTLASTGGLWTIDARGRVLARGSAPVGLPVLTAFRSAGLEAGDRICDGPAGAALRAFRSLPRSLRRSVVAVFAPTLERISFSLEDGLLVRYGAAERRRAKNNVLRALLGRLAQEGTAAAYVDVRVPEKPALSSSPPPEGEQLAGDATETSETPGGR
ncbi:hypothetical protein BH24ACT26_BH24ACT26_05580 [soil metagenome]